MSAEINLNSWKIPDLMAEISQKNKISFSEMTKTFNLGIGMVGVISPKELEDVSEYLARKKEKYYIIGEIKKGSKEKVKFIS